MKEKEFKKLKVGDKVRIVSERPKHHDYCSVMDKWLGKVMTVRDTSFVSKVRMEEDKGENWLRQGWSWYPEMIAEKVEYPTIVEHLIRGNKTIVKLSNGKVGVAECSPEDEFDYYEGLRIATARAYGKDEVKEIDRPAKLGEYIKIINPCLTFNRYNKGDILKVSEVKSGGTVYCETSFGNACIGIGEYVVLENYKPEVKCELKCSAADAMTSFAEAMRAFAKAMAPEVKEVKEVKRPAEVGEWIKITEGASFKNKYFKNGDILRVYKITNNGKTSRVGVFCELEKKTGPDTIYHNDNGNIVILDDEYVVLEGYEEPTVKEVKRHAKPGEYIKIVDPKYTFDEYKEGDILKVIRQGGFSNMVRCEISNGTVPVADGEYVVLENYKPEEKKVEEPKVKEVRRRAKVGEYIKIVNAGVTGGCYANGDILKVYKLDGEGFFRCGVFCETKLRLPKDTDIFNDDGNIVIRDPEYVVLENYKPEEK